MRSTSGGPSSAPCRIPESSRAPPTRSTPACSPAARRGQHFARFEVAVAESLGTQPVELGPGFRLAQAHDVTTTPERALLSAALAATIPFVP